MRAAAARLAAAARMASARLHAKEFGPYDGMFRHLEVVGAVAELFGPEKVFSPTALEDYIACPFRFFLGHVLGLEALEEPREEIEVTRRGQAVHRALSRLHGQLRAEVPPPPVPIRGRYGLPRLRWSLAAVGHTWSSKSDAAHKNSSIERGAPISARLQPRPGKPLPSCVSNSPRRRCVSGIVQACHQRR